MAPGTLGGMLTIGAVNASTIVIGTAAGQGMVYAGRWSGITARLKKISLAPSYAGAVYDSAGDTACNASANAAPCPLVDATNFKILPVDTHRASAQLTMWWYAWRY